MDIQNFVIAEFCYETCFLIWPVLLEKRWKKQTQKLKKQGIKKNQAKKV